MSATWAALAAALLIPVADAPQPANPVVAFLNAADVNDRPAMEALLDHGSAGFLKLISNCYLRRVYANQQTHELIASWMCAEGVNRSRVVLADVGLNPAGKVAVSVLQNNTNNRPAPERTGSALAD
jgi:hypothetical protein